MSMMLKRFPRGGDNGRIRHCALVGDLKNLSVVAPYVPPWLALPNDAHTKGVFSYVTTMEPFMFDAIGSVVARECHAGHGAAVSGFRRGHGVFVDVSSPPLELSESVDRPRAATDRCVTVRRTRNRDS